MMFDMTDAPVLPLEVVAMIFAALVEEDLTSFGRLLLISKPLRLALLSPLWTKPIVAHFR